MPSSKKQSIAWAKALIDDHLYQENFLVRWRAGLLHPSMERFVWEHAKGKPVERIEVSKDVDLTTLDDTELDQFIISLRDELSTQKRMNDDVPPTVTEQSPDTEHIH